MFILSRVCAEKKKKKGEVIHRVTPADRLGFHEAPDAIQEDPLFSMLVSEGSLEASVTPVRQKQLEADPLEGSDPAGRRRALPKKPAAGPIVRKEQNN